jgi:uncharacterized protein YegP (UPF0339 family)
LRSHLCVSEGYATPGAVTAGIDAVRRNAPMADRFAIMTANNGEFYLVLKGVRVLCDEHESKSDFFFFFSF